MKTIRRSLPRTTIRGWIVIPLIMAIYSLQVEIAMGDFDVSKRQDFATDDAAFHTNEDVYIKIGIDQAPRLDPGTARLSVRIKQGGKIRFRRILGLTVQTDKTEASYRDDIQPLFTQNRAWFDNPVLASFSCGTCHAWDGVDEEEGCDPACYHLMNLTTRAGLLKGADDGSIPILGESAIGATDYNWDESVLRKRLRNNRMPPGWTFTIDESNRNGPDISMTNDGDDLALTGSDFYVKRHPTVEDSTTIWEYEYGSDTHAVGLIGAWVDGTGAGLNEGSASYGGDTNVTWSDVAPFFTQHDAWFNGSLACSYCHMSNVEPPAKHAMDLTSAAGLRTGADAGEAPILGESAVGATDFNWDTSVLRQRLRNNRMPPTSPFVLDESNRDGRTLTHPVTGAPVRAVDLIGEWVNAGCPDN